MSMVLLRSRFLTGLRPKTPAAMSIAAEVTTGCAQSATSHRAIKGVAGVEGWRGGH